METLHGEKLELVSCSSTFVRAASPSEHSKPLNHCSNTHFPFNLTKLETKSLTVIFRSKVSQSWVGNLLKVSCLLSTAFWTLR
jgi:hypothetical protein